MRELEQASRDVQNRVNTCRAQQQNHEKQRKILQVNFQKAQDKVDRLEGELSEATPDAAAIEVLKDTLANAQEELQRTEGLFEDMVVQRDEVNRDAKASKITMEDAQKAVQNLEFKLQKAHATVRRLQGQREDELKKKNHAIAQVAAAQENRDIWAEEMRKAQVEVDTATEDAKTICPRRVVVPDGKSSEKLLTTLERLMATRRETEKKLGGSQDELLRLANDAKKTHKDAMQEFENIKSLRNVCQVCPCVNETVANPNLASCQYLEQSTQSMETVQVRHLGTSASHIQLPP